MRRVLGPGWWLLVVAAAAGVGAAFFAWPVFFPSAVHGCAPWDFPIMPSARLVSSQAVGGHCNVTWEVAGQPETAYRWYDDNLAQSDFLVLDRPAGGGRLAIVGRYGGSQHGTLNFVDAASGSSGARVDLDLTTEP